MTSNTRRCFIIRAQVSRKEFTAQQTRRSPYAWAEARREAMLRAELARAREATGMPVRAIVADRRRDAQEYTAFVSASAIVEFVVEPGVWWVPDDAKPMAQIINAEEE